MYSKEIYKQLELIKEVLALSALLQAGSENVGPNTIEEAIEKLDRYAFPEDYIDEVEDDDLL